jgi:hypothetical protein
MILSALRGLSRVTAAVTGLLLVYGSIYALEGITTRILTTSLHELAIATLWTLPWMLLFCSGLEDIGTVTRQSWIFWVGVALGFAFLYYFERNTTSTLLTKVAMPLLATAGGLLPHIIRRIRLLFTFCSLVAGIAGLVVLSLVSNTLLSSASSFASEGIAIIMVAFGTASLAAGALSVADVRRDILRES